MGQYKYELLKKYFLCSNKFVITLYFDEINKILNAELPSCLSGIGYNSKLLWNNSIGNYATRSWLEAGYIYESYDKENRSVTFRKNEVEAKRYLGNC